MDEHGVVWWLLTFLSNVGCKHRYSETQLEGSLVVLSRSGVERVTKGFEKLAREKHGLGYMLWLFIGGWVNYPSLRLEAVPGK